MKRFSSTVFTMLIAAALCACGGGGGGTTPTTTASQPTKAVVTLAVSGTGTMYGIDTTMTLPAGVTVRSTLNPPQVDSGVIIPAGSAAGTDTLATGIYTAATGTAPGALRLLFAKASGFSAGSIATISCSIDPSLPPAAADFAFSSFSASDQNGAPVAGFTPSLTVQLQ